MTIHSAADHGYSSEASSHPIRVSRHTTHRHRSAEGTHEILVLREHRDLGYWECVILEGPRTNAIWIRSERDILADMRAA